MLSWNVPIGQAVEIGGVVAIRVDEKMGRRVRLTIATALSPIRLIESGIIPDHYTIGISGEVRPMKPRILAG